MRRLLLLLLAACAPVDETGQSDSALLAYPSHHGGIDYTQAVTGIKYGGGPLKTTNPTPVYLLFYGSFSSTTAPIIERFVTSLSGSPLASVLSTYTDAGGHRASHHFDFDTGHVFFDSGSHGTVLDWNNTVDTLSDAIDNGHFPADPNAVYFLLSGSDVEVQSASGESVCSACAWHDSDSWMSWGVVANPAHCPATSSCAVSGPSPNNDAAADKMVYDVWHELAETVTDADTTSGYRAPLFNTNDGENEAADLCGSDWAHDGSHPVVGAVQYDLDYDPGNHSVANINLDGYDYFVQGIWQNADRGGCVRRLLPNRPAVALASTTGDLDGDGLTDLLWRDSATDHVDASLLHSADAGPRQLVDTADRDYEIYGVADFDKSGTADILWRDLVDHHLSLWLMNGLGESDQRIAFDVPAPEQVKAVGDFDGDKRADILFLNVSTNAVRVWYNHGLTSFKVPSLPVVSPGLGSSDDWESLGSGDFVGWGRSQVLWRDLANSGTYHVTWFSGSTSFKWDFTTSLAIIGLVDVDGDGATDAVGYTGSGKSPGNLAWIKFGANGLPGAPQIISAWPARQWRYSGGGIFADASGHRAPGILWRDRQTGDVWRWQLEKDGSIEDARLIDPAEPHHQELVGN